VNPPPEHTLSRPLTGLLVGLPVAGLCALALVLLLGGGAPQATPVGLPGAGPLVEWSLSIVPYLVTLSAVLTVGFALLGGEFIRTTGDKKVQVQALRVNVRAALVWAALSLVTVGLLALQFNRTTGDLAGLPGSAQVRAMLAQAGLAGAAAVAARWCPRLAVPLALAALVPDRLAGHALTADTPFLAAAAVVTHVVAAALWVGGLVAMGWLALRHRGAWATVVGGYSRLALGCVIMLGLTGVVATLSHINSPDQLLGSPYGAVVLIKSAALAGLVALGAMQRRHVVRRGRSARGRDVILLVGSELIVMTLVIALATGLAQTPPPI
jgi:putative copper resistance protein D